MIVCSCNVISDHDIENALIDLFNQPEAPIPTPGVVFRHLQKKMNCCGCAPLTVETIYEKVALLIERGAIDLHLGEEVRGKLLRLVPVDKSKKIASALMIPQPDRLAG